MTQIHGELEEAARTSGATGFTTLLRITFPLLLPPFIGGWVWVSPTPSGASASR